MKKITLWVFLLIFPLLSFAQTEGFEGATFPPTTPANWAVLDNGVGTGQSWMVTTDPTRVHSGLQAAMVDRESLGAVGSTSQDWLVTNQITVPANGQLRFWTRQSFVGNNGSTYEVRVSTDPIQTNQAAFTVLQSWTETTLNAVYNVYEEKIVSLAAYPAGTQLYIAFVKTATQTNPPPAQPGDRWLIDDMQIIQQCLDPSILNVGTVTPTTAVLTWTPNGAPANNFDVQVVLAGDPLGVNPSPNGTGVSPGVVYGSTAPALIPGTAYQFYVRANCGSGNYSQWVGPFNFTTRPAGSICSAPIVVPSGTPFVPYSHTSNTSIYGDEVDTPQGPGCAGGATNYMQGAEVFYSFTPTFTGNVTISMTPTGVSSSIFVYNGCANVGVACLAGVADATGNVRLIQPFAVTAGTNYIIAIASSTTPAAGIPYTLIIQEFNCNPPVGLPTTNINTTTADLSWTNPTGAVSWEVAVQPAGSGIPTGPGITANTNTNFTVGLLTPATAYQYWVRSDCGGGLFSPWAGPYTFNTTICDAVDRCNYVFRMTDTFGDGWNGGGRMEIRQNGIVVATIGSTFTTGTALNSPPVSLCQTLPFEIFFTVGGGNPEEIGVQVINNFTQTIATFTAGTIAVSNTVPIYSHSFNCAVPECLTPTTLTATALTTTGATLNWNGAGTGGTAWDVYVVPSGSPAPTAGTPATYPSVTSPFPITGLTPNTTYQFYVRTVCSPTSSSTWVTTTAIPSFTTLPTCSKPITLTATGVTASSAILNWTQPVNPGGSLAAAWEVIILPCGAPVPTPATPGWFTVTNKPHTVLGLTPLTCYNYYVRAICSSTDASPISDVKQFDTPDINDECANSKLVPVNQDTHCVQTVPGSVAGATASTQANTCGATADNDDVWFHFVATSTTHFISLLEPIVSNANPQFPVFSNNPPGGLNYSLYRGTNCGTLVQVSCRANNGTAETGLIIGETYKIRVYSPGTAASTKRFDVCVGTRVIYCNNSIPACAVNNIILRNDVGVPPTPNPISGLAAAGVGCLGSAPSPTFYYLTIQTNGNYVYHLEQSSISDFSNPVVNGIDIDYATWGPYPTVAAACGAMTVGNVRTAPLGCSFSAAEQEDFTINGAIAGQVYVIMVTNYSANSSPGQRGYVRITRTTGPAPSDCCPFASFSYSSSFFCKDGTNPLPILGTASTAGTYSCTNPALILNPITGEINLAASAVGTYTVVSTITGVDDCQTSVATYSVTITAPPAATIAYSAPTYCQSVATPILVTQTGSSGGFYSTIPASGLSINPTTGTITAGTSTPGIYTVKYIIFAGSGCPEYTATAQVEIKATPMGTIVSNDADNTICNNGSATISVVPTNFTLGAATYSWIFNGNPLPDTDWDVDPLLTGTGTYQVTVTLNGCTNIFTSLLFTVNPVPTAIISSGDLDNTICSNETALITLTPTNFAPGAATYAWTFNGNPLPDTDLDVDPLLTGTGTYVVTVTLNGCSEQFSLLFTVNPLPIGVIDSGDADNTVCSDEAALLTVVPTNFVLADATYAWTVNGNPLPDTDWDVVPLVTGTYQVTVTLNGCTNIFTSLLFTVNPVPTGIFASTDADNTVCSDETAMITLTPTNFAVGDATYVWTFNGNPLPDTDNDVDPLLTGTGTYVVTVTLNGCSQPFTLLFTVNTKPIATLDSAETDHTICSNETATIFVAPTNFVLANATYVWTVNGNPLPDTDWDVVPSVTGLYQVVITLNGCVTTPTAMQFTVNTTPDFTLTGTNLIKCAGETAVLSVTNPNFSLTDPAITYTWTLDGNPLAATTSSINVTAYGTYAVVVNNSGCMSVPKEIEVSLDTADIPMSTTGECFGPSFIITALPVSGSFDPTAVTYEWTNGSGTVVGSNQNTFNVTEYVAANNIVSFPIVFTVKIITAPDGCSTTQEFTVVGSNCTIQKGISPNGDGDNDSFDLRGLGVKHLGIFNRYGTKVYSQSNYSNEWHGQSEKGNELPDGTYYYVIDQNSGESKSGWIYINK